MSDQAPQGGADSGVPHVTVHEAQALVDGGALLVDVREAAELEASGKLAGAIHIPRGHLPYVASEQSPEHDPRFQLDRPVVLYCAAGVRSGMAGEVLKSLGFSQVFNLGGFKDGVAGGWGVERG